MNIIMDSDLLLALEPAQIRELPIDKLDYAISTLKESIDGIRSQLMSAQERITLGFEVDNGWVHRASGAIGRRKRALKQMRAEKLRRNGKDPTNRDPAAEMREDCVSKLRALLETEFATGASRHVVMRCIEVINSD